MLVAEALSKSRRVRLSIKNRRQVIWRNVAVSRPLAHCYPIDERGRVADAPLAVMPLASIARLLTRYGFHCSGAGIWERAA